MQQKIFNQLLHERMDEIQKVSAEIDFNNLTYSFTSTNKSY